MAKRKRKKATQGYKRTKKRSIKKIQRKRKHRQEEVIPLYSDIK